MCFRAEELGPAITVFRDPRVTRFGTFLRKWKLDELPQLWNVLKGEMSLVGPRPELPCYVAGYSTEQRGVLAVKPGITDPASLHYREEERLLSDSDSPERFYRQDILPHKLAMNLRYIENMSLFRDLALIFFTLRFVYTCAAKQDTQDA